MKESKTFVTSIDWSNHPRYISWCVRSEPARVPRRNTASRRRPFWFFINCWAMVV